MSTSNVPTTYDYIVVGAGSAGAVVASRLSESGAYTVLCLEAGSEGSDYFWSRVPVGVAKMIDNPAVNWCYSAEPDAGSGGRRIEVPRGKMLGGSSSINGMVFIRGQAQDYDHWAQLGNRGWSYQDVLPVFKKMERYDGGSDEFRGRNGILRVTDSPRHNVPLLEKMIEAAEKIGLPFNPDLNGATQEGIGMSQVTIARGRRQSTAYCYLDPVRNRPNLTIEQSAMAGTLILDGKRCAGVRYTVNGEQREARATREVIVSGGSINSPKLLELSGIGQSDRLRALGIAPVHELRGVGENLRDHYSPRVKFAITQKNERRSSSRRILAGWHHDRRQPRRAQDWFHGRRDRGKHLAHGDRDDGIRRTLQAGLRDFEKEDLRRGIAQRVHEARPFPPFLRRRGSGQTVGTDIGDEELDRCFHAGAGADFGVQRDHPSG